MKVIFLGENNELADKLIFILEGLFHTQVEPFKTLADCIHSLSHHNEDHIILCQDDYNGFIFLKYLASIDSQTPIILISIQDSNKDCIPFPNLKIIGIARFSQLENDLRNLLQITVNHDFFQVDPILKNYYRVKTEWLLKTIPLMTDIYLRISKEKFIKIFNQGAHFTQEDVDRYRVDKKIEYLYLKNEGAMEFIKKFTSNTELHLNTSPKQGLTSIEVSQDHISKNFNDLINLLQIQPEFIKQTKEHMDRVKNHIKQFQQLNQYFELVLQSSKEDITNHSLNHAKLISYLALKMKVEDSLVLDSLLMASFFHDLDLIQNQREYLELDFDRVSLTSFDENQFRRHPISSFNLIWGLPGVPEGVEVLIKQHHEKPNGKGFPMQISHGQISFESSLFILSHEFIDYIHSNQDPFNHEKFLKKYFEFYNQGHFKTIIDRLFKKI